MTDTDALAAITDAADRLVPELSERLRRHGLAEIEVQIGDLHLRVAADGPPPAGARRAEDVAAPTAASGQTSAEPAAGEPTPAAIGVVSPAVGFFVYGEGLGPGQEVGKGDRVGYVEMLGVRHDVHAPRRGVVRHLVAESGEAVEYGQVVVEIEAEASR